MVRLISGAVALLAACVLLPAATAGANPTQGCDGSHHSDSGNGANHSGPYDNTCDGSPSLNGNGNGAATGKPCAGCVGNADDKNPQGQYPNGSDHNAGYECDTNHGVGRTNPAHTGCKTTTVTPPTPPTPPQCPNAPGCEHGGQTPPTPTPTPTTTPTPQQLVLGTQVEGGKPSKTAIIAPQQQKVLGERTTGRAKQAPEAAPAAAVEARAGTGRKALPFSGADPIALLVAGALALLGGIGLRRAVAERT
jgi:hypothetical protein